MTAPGVTPASTGVTSEPYPIPDGVQLLPDRLLDLRPDGEIDNDIKSFRPVTGEKNIWFFWDHGYDATHSASKRTIRGWFRRFSKSGWTVRVVDQVPGSNSNIDHFVDVKDPELFPRAFAEGTLKGEYAPQHASDLVRWPLLNKHGGVWADVGLLQIGDIDRLWNETICNPESPYQLLAYGTNKEPDPHLHNYFMAARPKNAFLERCLQLLLALWASDGGRDSQTDMCCNGLLKEVPLIGAGFGLPNDTQKALSDYVTQMQVMKLVMRLVDEETGWNGPAYTAKHAYIMDFVEASSLYNDLTQQNGAKQFELMSLPLPRKGEPETLEQGQAREIIEKTLRNSFGFKLAHGMPVVVIGDTLGALWRKYDGADNVPGSFAHWLRYAAIHCNPFKDPPPLIFDRMEPLKRGPLLREM